MNISYSIPAYLSDFSTVDDNRTTAQLKMFYVGETADGRVFDKEFAEQLVSSLPYTPVVAFYSDLKDDFIGHNSTQYIYGIVKGDAKCGFETDDKGTEWFTTEVLLYTDRIDNIGEVAKKIVGHSQSLEMDPNSVEYEVFKDNGKTKIAFKKAKLAGLSVLGTEQKPAFTGSEFFIDQKDLRERFENFFSCLEQKDRGASMENKEKFVELLNFVKLSYNEKQKMIAEYAQAQFGDEVGVFVPEMFDDHCVIGTFNWYTGEEKFTMYDYTISEQGVELSNERKCFQRFVTMEDLQKMEGQNFEENENPKSEESSTNPLEPKEGEKIGEKSDCGCGESEPKKEDTDETDYSAEDGKSAPKPEDEGNNNDYEKDNEEEKEVENKEDAPEEKNEGANDDENKDKEKDGAFNNAAFSDSERQELENYRAKAAQVELEKQELENFRLEKRINLVNSYKDELPAETIQSFKEMAKTVSYEELEAKLAIEYRKFSKQNIKNNEVAFSFGSLLNDTQNNNESNDYASLVKRYSRK